MAFSTYRNQYAARTAARRLQRKTLALNGAPPSASTTATFPSSRATEKYHHQALDDSQNESSDTRNGDECNQSSSQLGKHEINENNTSVLTAAKDDSTQRSHPTVSPFRSLSSSASNEAPNLTRLLTGGLTELYARINEKRKAAAQAPVPPAQHIPQSFTRPDGHLLISDALPLLNDRFRVLHTVGEGTFSQLALAIDTFAPSSIPHPARPSTIGQAPPVSNSSHSSRPSSSKKRIALKIMNIKYSFIGLQEVEKLWWLNVRDPHNESHILRLLDAFYFQSHLCLVMELLGTSLLGYMKTRPHHRVSHDFIRKIALQLCVALSFVGSCNMIHGDMKPENVLLTQTSTLPNPSPSADGASSQPPSKVSASVKLIDFGNAMTGSEASLYFNNFDVQTLYYRAPEVLLGVSFGAAIDMWSLGCILVELATGKPLFHCTSNRELFTAMINTLGPMPITPFGQGKFAKKYFTHPSFAYSPNSSLGLNHSPSSLRDSTQYQQLVRFNTLGNILQTRDRDFVSFISGLLEYDPAARLTPLSAMFHPYFGRLFPLGLLFNSSADCLPALMKVQQKNTKPSMSSHSVNSDQQQQSVLPTHPPLQQSASIDSHRIANYGQRIKVMTPPVGHPNVIQSNMQYPSTSIASGYSVHSPQMALYSSSSPSSVPTHSPSFTGNNIISLHRHLPSVSDGAIPSVPRHSPLSINVSSAATNYDMPVQGSNDYNRNIGFQTSHSSLRLPQSGAHANTTVYSTGMAIGENGQQYYYPIPVSSFISATPSPLFLSARPPPVIPPQYPQSPLTITPLNASPMTMPQAGLTVPSSHTSTSTFSPLYQYSSVPSSHSYPNTGYNSPLHSSITSPTIATADPGHPVDYNPRPILLNPIRSVSTPNSMSQNHPHPLLSPQCYPHGLSNDSSSLNQSSSHLDHTTINIENNLSNEDGTNSSRPSLGLRVRTRRREDDLCEVDALTPNSSSSMNAYGNKRRREMHQQSPNSASEEIPMSDELAIAQQQHVPIKSLNGIPASILARIGVSLNSLHALGSSRTHHSPQP